MAQKPKLAKLNQTDFETWVPARQAMTRAHKALGSRDTVIKELTQRLWRGLIRSGAESHYDHEEEETRGLVEIESDRWGNFESPRSSDFWGTGSVTLIRDVRPHPHGYSHSESVIDYFGVRFDPLGLEKITGPIEAQPASTTPSPPPIGGRPKAAWREPVLIELAGQMLDGDLKPKKLADLEAAAQVWLGKKGEYPGERTVREVVRPLFLRFLQEGKNPKA